MSDINVLPVIDYSDLVNENSNIVNVVGQSFRKFGILRIKNHPHVLKLKDQVLMQANNFFNLHEDIKLKYFHQPTGGFIGYFNLPDGLKDGGDNGENYFLEGAEFWHSYKEAFESENEIAYKIENKWPDQLLGFKDSMLRSSSIFNKTSHHLLNSLSSFAGVPKDTLSSLTLNGWSMHRVMRYPPKPSAKEGDVRVKPHRDITMLSYLIGGTTNGLEVLIDKKWVPVNSDLNEIIVCSAEILEIMSNGFYQSSFHRVVHNQQSHLPRTTLIYFTMPHPDTQIEPIKYFKNISLNKNSLRYQSIPFLKYLEENLLVRMESFRDKLKVS